MDVLQGELMENAEKLPGPVILDVEPTSCSLTTTQSRDEGSSLPSCLVMSLRVVEDQVRTPDARDLTNVVWSMTFYENGSGNQFTELHNAIGMINYYAEWQSKYDDMDGAEEACHAWANLDSPTFAVLRDMALAGKLPSSLRLHAYGMDYGWEPDGTAKVWDVKAYKNAVISKIEFITKFVHEPVRVRDDTGTFVAPQETPERPELVALRGLTKAVEQVNTRVGWLFALVALSAVILILR